MLITTKVWVVLKPDQKVAHKALIEWRREELARYTLPREIAFTDAIPKSGVGKLLRRELVCLHNESNG
jgi:acyl-CoA synthetase (AMP-forming)/AMP-acid ligase II